MPNIKDIKVSLKESIIVLIIELIGIFILWYLASNTLITTFSFFAGIISLAIIVFVAQILAGITKWIKKHKDPIT